MLILRYSSYNNTYITIYSIVIITFTMSNLIFIIANLYSLISNLSIYNKILCNYSLVTDLILEFL